MAGNSGQDGVSVASRLFAVLDAFDGPAVALRLTEIARRAALPPATASRMVRELVSWGGLERQGDGTYRLGRRMWLLGSRAPCPRRMREAAGPRLRGLREATGLAASFVILDGTRALVVEYEAAPAHAAPCAPRLPAPLAPHATAAGKVLLAYAGADVLKAVLEAGLGRLTPYTVHTPGVLTRQLRRIRAGYAATADEESRLGLVDFAVPVRAGTGGRVLAALALAAAAPVPARRRLHAVRALEATAAELSRELGLGPGD